LQRKNEAEKAKALSILAAGGGVAKWK